jgi:hypothetical protein
LEFLMVTHFSIGPSPPITPGRHVRGSCIVRIARLHPAAPLVAPQNKKVMVVSRQSLINQHAP